MNPVFTNLRIKLQIAEKNFGVEWGGFPSFPRKKTERIGHGSLQKKRKCSSTTTAWIGSFSGLKSEIPFDLAQGRLSTSSGQALGHPDLWARLRNQPVRVLGCTSRRRFRYLSIGSANGDLLLEHLCVGKAVSDIHIGEQIHRAGRIVFDLLAELAHEGT